MQGFFGLPIEYFTHNDRNCYFGLSATIYLILLGTFATIKMEKLGMANLEHHKWPIDFR